MAGLALVQASSDAWPVAGYQAEDALNRGWLPDQSLTSTGGFTTVAAPSTATAFLSTGDGTTGTGNGFYTIGRRLRVVHNGGTAYAAVSSAALAAGQTTVTLTDWTNAGTTSLSTGSITSVGVAAGYAGAAGPLSSTAIYLLDRIATTASSSAGTLVINSTADQTMYLYTVNAGLLGSSRGLRLTLGGDLLNNSGIATTYRWRLGFGGGMVFDTTAASVAANATRRPWRAVWEVLNTGTPTGQHMNAWMILGQPAAFTLAVETADRFHAVGFSTGAEISTGALNMSVRMEIGAASTTRDVRLQQAILEMLP